MNVPYKKIFIIAFCIIFIYSCICTYVLFGGRNSYSSTREALDRAQTELTNLSNDVGAASTSYSDIATKISSISTAVSNIEQSNKQFEDSSKTITDGISESVGSIDKTVSGFKESAEDCNGAISEISRTNKELTDRITGDISKLNEVTK